jgi:hypothetical protein
MASRCPTEFHGVVEAVFDINKTFFINDIDHTAVSGHLWVLLLLAKCLENVV